MIILNTRSAQALESAGIPRSAWNGINKTGDSFFEALLDGQPGRNPGELLSGISTNSQFCLKIHLRH